MRKRAISLLLALVLALSPAPAAAHDGPAPAYEEQVSQLGRSPAPEEQAPAPEEQAPAHGSSPALKASASAVTGWEERVPYTARASSAPWTQSSYGATVDEDEVRRTINSYRGIYPEGTHWTNEDNEYVLSVPCFFENERKNYTVTGYGCVAFCYELLDAAFDTPIAYRIHDFTYDDIRIGDCLRVDNDQHIVTVIEKNSSYVALAEGNYNSSVHWDRTMTREEVMQADYLVTRYPRPAPASLEISVDKPVVVPWERVSVYIRSPMTSTYNISLWRGDVGSGNPVAESRVIPATDWYWFEPNSVGLYTVYVETVNADGRLISGTASFYVTDGSPDNVTVSTDKSQYSLGETVYFSYDADRAERYEISIWLGEYDTGTPVCFITGASGRDTYQPEKAGTYTLRVEAVNSKGAASATCRFTVTGGAPSDLKLTADRGVFVVGEPFYIYVTAADMTGFNAELWRGEYKTGTRVASENNFAPAEPIEVTLGSTARYTLYVEAYNDYGTVSATMSMSAVVNASSTQFTDVPRNAYYAGAVDWALKTGVTTGTGDTEFSPNATLTRGQAVTFLWRAMGQPVPAITYNMFRDVSDSEYYYEAVQWAVENGVTNGVSDTEFDPEGFVTRGQMVTFLWRALGKPGNTGQGEWYADAEYWARANSLLTGTALGYATDDDCPRGDVVFYMWKALA